jgi:hypothetical protein
VVGFTQVEPEQHPAGQLVALQVQTPPTQAWPTPQEVLLPHRQTPVLQLLALVRSQGPQVRPLVPQFESVGGVMQVPLLQQPVAQLAAVQPLQLLLVHVCPVGQT